LSIRLATLTDTEQQSTLRFWRNDVKLPNANNVRIDREKLTGYLLNSAHPEGRGKAQFFLRAGFTLEAWSDFADSLRIFAAQTDVHSILSSEHGCKYIVEGSLQTPLGQFVQIRTIWVVDTGGEIPRLVTAYPIKERVAP